MKSKNIFLSDITGECEICHNEKANYRCPKCGVIYCSSNCFKNHNEQCLNKFANDLIKEYPAPKATFESQLRMQKILEENAENDLQSFNPSLDNSININNSNNINTNPKIHVEVEPWDAWWQKKVIVNFPKPQSKPPPQASELLPFHLVDILYSYCYTMRLYNGDVTFDFDGSFDVMNSISSILSTKETLPSIRFALNQCVNNSKRPDIFIEYQWMIEVVHDVELCLQSNAHVFRALSEAKSIAKEAKQKHAYLKLEFFFSWAQTLTSKALEKLSDDVHDYYTSLQALYFDVCE
ncbi:HIT zinc finger family protein [Tritrichomonas foetus]|uniref:HIT zinc finger family protein n=1 Tax=Tritrichomonas foetus TaxID=1144522 RepID=A0A1J4JT34_9EUKA|nr:HIT zinc finger family protein [Tritrichomonas foetus]|eukprot:OHT02281.1 HIT zinc finger family protein [Tritrichomonas foetus]